MFSWNKCFTPIYKFKEKKKQPKELHHTFASLWLLVNKLCNNMLNLNSYKPKNSCKSIIWIPHCTSKSFLLGPEPRYRYSTTPSAVSQPPPSPPTKTIPVMNASLWTHFSSWPLKFLDPQGKDSTSSNTSNKGTFRRISLS